MQDSDLASPPGSSGLQDPDVELPDAPPLKTEEPEYRSHVDLENLFDADSGDEDALNSSSVAAAAATMASSSPPRSSPPAPSSSDLPSSSATIPVNNGGSNNNNNSTGPAPTISTKNQNDPQLMLQYYSRLFPFRTLFQWLNHSLKPGPDFSNREFAFTLSNDAYLRYQSYPTADLLRRDVLRLNPSRFEIGPVYTANPRDRKTLRKSTAFRPLAKEVVLDIDLTDYDDIRTCCDKAKICGKCWRFVSMAIKVLDAALRQDFGFEHILWVYSGRRGAHAWVSDRRAREMDDDKRRALAGYLEVIRGGAQGGKRVQVKRPLHPHLSRSVDMLKRDFQSVVLEDQNPFVTTTTTNTNINNDNNNNNNNNGGRGADRLLSLLPADPPFLSALRAKWSAVDASTDRRSSARKWSDIDAVAATGVSDSLDARALRDAKQDILLEYTYPRLDVEVSKKRIHLLKSPFVVHPATGRVCVPITADAAAFPHQVDAFDPLTVPTVAELLAQLDNAYCRPRAAAPTAPTAAADGGGGGGRVNGEEGEKEKANVNVNGQAGRVDDNKNDDDDDDRRGQEADIMDGFVAQGSGKVRKLLDWEKTSLKVYVERFEDFVKALLRAEVRRKRERERDEDDGGGGGGGDPAAAAAAGGMDF